jgi:starch phosphorylase
MAKRLADRHQEKTMKIAGMGALKHDYLAMDEASMKESLANLLVYAVGKDPLTATRRDWFVTTAYAVRDRLIERWMETMRSYYHEDAKRVYYFSLEFLIGRLLTNSMLNMGFYEECCAALREIGLDLEEIKNQEPDAALGNGGLGRLAACFLDSMATLRLPGYGYGIRYEYGMFNQRIENGNQVEHPDNWLRYGNPWEFARPEVLHPVKFHGRVVEYCDEHGNLCHNWVDAEEIMAMAYDTPIPGYNTNTVNNLRLWAAKATREFDLKYFNEGNYIRAVEDKNVSENLSKVLYPDDTTGMGRTLRLQQEYFFVSASLQDILRRYVKFHDSFDALPDKVAIQLNDTHPSIAIAEMMRLLVDGHHVPWQKAWELTVNTFAYTNHTLMPEALETWPVSLMESLLPRHMQIIYEINHRFLEEIRHRHPGDMDRLRRMSLIDETGTRRVRMAHLAIVGSHKVNGVAKLHTELMKSTIFKDFDEFYPGKIVNMTNGVTPRRWVNQTNPALSSLISKRIGRGWLTDLSKLKKLIPLAEEDSFREEYRLVKKANKERLADWIEKHLQIAVNPESLFDVQIKRIHEYKRQLLNVLHVITRYNRIRHQKAKNMVARTVVFAGKAAPGYFMAKLIIKLINDVADVINHDPMVGDLLKVVFIPNYDVSTASDILPAAELSEQISTAGTEASGTGNMKLALNGALTIGTLDGANIEIAEEVSMDNIFIFGLTAQEVVNLKTAGYNPWDYYHGNAELKEALDMVAAGYFSMDATGRYAPVFDALTQHGDRYMLLADYPLYLACQNKVDALYRDPHAWTRKSIMNIAGMGKFSSDRTIKEYAEKIWNVKPVAHE